MIILQLIFAFILAVLVNGKFRGINFSKGVLIIPYLLNGVIIFLPGQQCSSTFDQLNKYFTLSPCRLHPANTWSPSQRSRAERGRDADHEDPCQEYGFPYEKHRTREKGTRTAGKRGKGRNTFYKVASCKETHALPSSFAEAALCRRFMDAQSILFVMFKCTLISIYPIQPVAPWVDLAAVAIAVHGPGL